jgi:hypothetical protein
MLKGKYYTAKHTSGVSFTQRGRERETEKGLSVIY